MRAVVSTAWSVLVGELRMGEVASGPALSETAATELFGSTLHRLAGMPVAVQHGQAVGARAAELRVYRPESGATVLVATFRWFPPNLYRAHGYRLKLREDVRRLAALRALTPEADGVAFFVDLVGVVRAEFLAKLAREHPAVPLHGYSARYGELAGGESRRLTLAREGMDVVQ